MSTPASKLRADMLAPFGVRSFRYQWLADLTTSWAFEMEVLILGWYVLVQSDSVMLLVVYGSLQYIGSLVSPLIGVAGDRLGYRSLFLAARAIYTLLALTILTLAVSNTLSPLAVLIISAISGLFRPSDVMMRFSLIAQTLPSKQLIGALGTSRITIDSARLAGAVAGVGIFAAFGIAWAYVAVTGLYALSAIFTTGIARFTPPAEPLAAGIRMSPLQDLRQGFRHVIGTPPLFGMLCIAFLVNMLAYPLCQGLLPYVANNVYQSGQGGLALLGASYALGGLIGSLALSVNRLATGPARLCLATCFIWFLFDLGFGLAAYEALGAIMVVGIGFLQSVCMTPLAGVMLKVAAPDYRGRVMGMRILAIWGLPTGLVLSGPLIEALGFAGMVSVYSIAGMVLTLLIAIVWRRHLWARTAPANSGAPVSR